MDLYDITFSFLSKLHATHFYLEVFNTDWLEFRVEATCYIFLYGSLMYVIFNSDFYGKVVTFKTNQKENRYLYG